MPDLVKQIRDKNANVLVVCQKGLRCVPFPKNTPSRCAGDKATSETLQHLNASLRCNSCLTGSHSSDNLEDQ